MEINAVQAAILGLFACLSSMTMLVQSQHREKERIQSLNRQLGQANMQLNEANEKLRVYAVEVEHMAETRERNRLAREIHGILVGIGIGIVEFDPPLHIYDGEGHQLAAGLVLRGYSLFILGLALEQDDVPVESGGGLIVTDTGCIYIIGLIGVVTSLLPGRGGGYRRNSEQ